MEKIAGDMSGLLQETLDRYQDLKSLLVTEKTYIENMDVKQLWSAADQKKRLVQSIEEIVSKILSRASKYTAHFDMTVQNFTVGEVVSALPLRMKVKSQLKYIGNRIDACKKEISLLAYENKRYIVEYLSVIDGIFSTIRQTSATENQYSQNGQIYSPGDNTRIINAEV
jgi:hypothetical protein